MSTKSDDLYGIIAASSEESSRPLKCALGVSDVRPPGEDVRIDAEHDDTITVVVACSTWKVVAKILVFFLQINLFLQVDFIFLLLSVTTC